MFSRFVLFFSFCVVLASCSKSSDSSSAGYTCNESAVVVPDSEMTSLRSYILANHPAAVLDTGGFYYEILAAGTGTVTPSACLHPIIGAKYAGYLTNGFKFDESLTGTLLNLRQVIGGWQRGIPRIKNGGSINLYIPPSLGYGEAASASIPAHSTLVFNIQLIDVQ